MNQKPDSFGCIANTIKVALGHQVDLANPLPAMFEIESIASALSKICRYGGHCPMFYSVAEHSVLATSMAVSDGVSGEALAAVFLHDAAEAYIGDVVKPLKTMLPDYAIVEQRIEQAIGEAFDVDFVRFANIIKRFDRMMLKAEKSHLWPDDKNHWPGFDEIIARDAKIQCWGHEEAKWNFLAMARSLHLTK